MEYNLELICKYIITKMVSSKHAVTLHILLDIFFFFSVDLITYFNAHNLKHPP